MSALLDRNAFEAWLKAQPRRRVVGQRVSADNCPIAIYLKEALGYKWAGASQTGYHVSSGTPGSLRDYKTPAWASAFITRWDFRLVTHGTTARDALRVLSGWSRPWRWL